MFLDMVARPWRRSARWILILSCSLILSSEVSSAQSFAPSPPEEEAPALSDFPEDLVENFTGLWAAENLTPFLIGTAGTLSAMPFQDRTKGFFEKQGRWQGFDGLGKEAGKSQCLGPAIGLSLLLSRTTKDTKYKKFTYSLAQGFVVTNVVSGGIKELVGRQRPDQTTRLSFPSGHTANSFMLATVATHHYGWKAGVPAYAFATYVGASRLQSRKHYLTDVIAGATLGYIVGQTVTRQDSKNRERRFQWGVSVPPGGGAAVGVGIRLW